MKIQDTRHKDTNKFQIPITKRFGILNLFLVSCLFLGICFLFLVAVQSANAATLYIYPQAEEVYEGGSVVAEVRLDTEGDVVNTIEATALVLGEQFEIVDFSTGGSVFPIFVQGPEILNEDPSAGSGQGGSVFFQAIVPGGFEGEGVVGKLLLRARNLGTGIIKMAQGSKVLLNDGQGTSIETNFLDTQYRVVERPEGLVVLESESHPIETEWRSGPFIRIKWETKEGAEYSYVLSRLADEVPDEVPEEVAGDIKLTTSEEGVFYFHVRECLGDEGEEVSCGPVATRQILRDTSAPEEFEVVPGSEPHVYNGQKFLSFVTSDKYSGISHFEVYEGDKRYVAKSPYVLNNQAYMGDVVVKAIDKAGNTRESVVTISGETSKLSKGFIFGIIGSIGAALVVTFLIWRRRKFKTENEKVKTTN